MDSIDKDIINIAIVGSSETDTGQKTSTLVEQIGLMDNMNVKALYNKDIEKAKLILKDAGLLEKFECVSNISGDESLVFKKNYTSNLEALLDIRDIDIVLVSEMNIEEASNVIFNCLIKGKNIINLNAISEVTLGFLFKKLSNINNAIYSVGAGDEPAATLDLIHYCLKLGLKIICAGKGKNNPLNIYSTPDNFVEKAKQINVSPTNITSFVDGTKTMVEMAILSNATGFTIDKIGMHGSKANVADLINTFRLKENGGILKKFPVIDYVVGDVAPGVFVVFTSKQKSIISELKYLKMGNGPNFVLYKPYHLGNIEAPLSIYDVIFKKRPTLTIKDKMITSVVARAKKDLKAGEFFDSVGGYTFSGITISYEEMIDKNYVPIGLVENSRARKDIKRDEILSFENIQCNTDSIIYNLWKLQKKII